jgi:hypothetical protein
MWHVEQRSVKNGDVMSALHLRVDLLDQRFPFGHC